MADHSAIEWTDATWNPVTGCTKISPGCKHCYAERLAKRLQAMGNPRYRNRFRVTLHRDQLELPLRWRRPKRIFVNSMSDLFHERVPEEFIADVLRTAKKTPWHTYQILTKRPDRMAEITTNFPQLRNVWLGTSVENADYLDRIDELRCVRSAVRFVSFEPLLGSVAGANLTNIQWAIVGGESGPRARPMDRRWVYEIEEACRRFGTAFFFKQWGGKNKKAAGRVIDGRTYDEMPSVPI